MPPDFREWPLIQACYFKDSIVCKYPLQPVFSIVKSDPQLLPEIHTWITTICTTKTDDDRLFLAQAECGVLGLCRPSSPSCLTSQFAPPVRSTAQDPAFLGSLLDWPLAFFLPSLLDFTS